MHPNRLKIMQEHLNKLNNFSNKLFYVYLFAFSCALLPYIFYIVSGQDSYFATLLYTVAAAYITSSYLLTSNESPLNKLLPILPSAICLVRLYIFKQDTGNSSSSVQLFFEILSCLLVTSIIFRVLFKKSNMNHSNIKTPATVLILSSALILGSGIFIEEWLAKEKLPFAISLFGDFFTVLLVCYVAAVRYLFKKYKTKKPDKFQSEFYDQKTAKITSVNLITILLIFFIAVVSLATKITFFSGQPIDETILYAANWQSLYFIFPAIMQIYNLRNKLSSTQLANSLVKQIDTKLFARSIKKNQGISTVSHPSYIYTIDTDPYLAIEKSIPSTLNSIRNEEFERSLDRAISPKPIGSIALGSRYSGGINPSGNPTKLLDILAVFSNIALEINPIVEKRIINLCRLFNILDPDLAKNIDVKKVEQSLTNNGIFFFLDFNWVDQYISVEKNNTFYKSVVNPPPTYILQGISKYESKSMGIGKLIWFTKSARAHAIKEFPAIKRILQETPIEVQGDLTTSHQNGKVELFFTMKVDELLPFIVELDLNQKSKNILKSLDVTSEATKIHTILTRRINLARSPVEIRRIIDAIMGYNWTGFKEKDLAIGLLIELWTNRVAPLKESEKGSFSKFNSVIISSIFTIGYPSKHFHHAQLEKQNIRSVEHLDLIACDPAHPQHEEVWLLLSGGIEGRLEKSDKQQIINIIESAMKKDDIFRNINVQINILDCITFTLTHLSVPPYEDVDVLLKAYLSKIAQRSIEKQQILQIAHRLEYLAELAEQNGLSSDIRELCVSIIERFERETAQNIGVIKQKVLALNFS